MNNKKTGYPSIDRPWLKYYSKESINAPLPKCTVYENIASHNLQHPNDVAMIYFGHKITYQELFHNIDLSKHAFLKLGVKKGDKVILFTSSTPETVYAILALCRIGAVANMINPLFTEQQVIDRINETSANLMIVLDQFYGKVTGIIQKTCVATLVIVPVAGSMPIMTRIAASISTKQDIPYSETVLRWDDFIAMSKGLTDNSDEIYEASRPLIMVYSSGTTGASKGIVLTNDGINATISHYQSPDFPYERGNTFLQMIPVWFSTGIVLSVLMPICLGITVILEPVFSKESFAQDIKKYKPNMTLAATSLWIYAASCPELEHTNLSKMVYPITGGEQVLPKVENTINQFLNRHGCQTVLLKGYGMCELGSTVSTETPTVHKHKTTGFPISGVVVSAFNQETNRELKYYERGEIRVLSPARMEGYFQNPDATNKYFYTDENGAKWGCTGDIGYIDEDGFVYVLGRAGDTYLSSQGRKVYCFDIENVILRNPDIAQCEVVGIPFDGYEIPVAHIVLENQSSDDVFEILKSVHKSCLANLDGDCVPCGYRICKGFPVKNNGKRDMEQIKQERSGFVLPDSDSLKDIHFPDKPSFGREPRSVTNQ